MTVGSLGDFTSRLSKLLTVETAVRIEGPFGRFERPRSGKPELWIAGGIGITHFVAWAPAMNDRDNAVTLVYCVRNEDSAAQLQELLALATDLSNFTLRLHASNLSVAFCGPEAMRKAMSTGFAARGVPVRKIRYEEFEIRSGIGLKAFAAYLTDRMTRPRPSRPAKRCWRRRARRRRCRCCSFSGAWALGSTGSGFSTEP